MATSVPAIGRTDTEGRNDLDPVPPQPEHRSASECEPLHPIHPHEVADPCPADARRRQVLRLDLDDREVGQGIDAVDHALELAAVLELDRPDVADPDAPFTVADWVGRAGFMLRPVHERLNEAEPLIGLRLDYAW